MFAKAGPEVLVVGAGPVGLFTALCLVRRDVRVEIVDEQWRPAAHSYALMLHPRSLRLLDEVGLLRNVLERAYAVLRVGLYDEGGDRRAEMRFSALNGECPFVAVVRQDVLEDLLAQELLRLGIRVRWNHRVSRIRSKAGGAAASIDRLEKESVGYAVAHTEWVIAKRMERRIPFVVGADGHGSFVRRSLDIEFAEVGEAETFAVFEFQTDADLDGEARVVMGDRTTSVLWPMPDGRCRWSFQVLDPDVADGAREKSRLGVTFGTDSVVMLNEDVLRKLIRARAPWFNATVGEINWRILTRFERRMAVAFGRDRIWLAGDAGHITGPVGGQSMNIGLREAHEVAGIAAGVVRGEDSRERLIAFERNRLREWAFLLGLVGGLEPTDQADQWIRNRAGRMLSCIPASGYHLARLAGDLSLLVREDSIARS